MYRLITILGLLAGILISSPICTNAQLIWGRAGLRETKAMRIIVENLDDDQRFLGLTKEMYRDAVIQGFGSCGVKVTNEDIPLYLYLKPSVMINLSKSGAIKGPVTGMVALSLQQRGTVSAPNSPDQLVFGLNTYFESSKQFVFDYNDYRNSMLLGIARTLGQELCSAINDARQNPGSGIDQAIIDASCVAKNNVTAKPSRRPPTKGVRKAKPRN